MSLPFGALVKNTGICYKISSPQIRCSERPADLRPGFKLCTRSVVGSCDKLSSDYIALRVPERTTGFCRAWPLVVVNTPQRNHREKYTEMKHDDANNSKQVSK